MLIWDNAAAYLSKSFVEPQLHIYAPLANLLSRLICQASVRLLGGVQCIPVYTGAQLLKTYPQSLDCLERGTSLLIFPEDPTLPRDEQCQMSPFRPGSAHLGELYLESTGNCLQFVPAALHTIRPLVRLGESV